MSRKSLDSCFLSIIDKTNISRNVWDDFSSVDELISLLNKIKVKDGSPASKIINNVKENTKVQEILTFSIQWKIDLVNFTCWKNTPFHGVSSAMNENENYKYHEDITTARRLQQFMVNPNFFDTGYYLLMNIQFQPVYDNQSTERCMWLENNVNLPVVGLNSESFGEPTTDTNLNIRVSDVNCNSDRFLWHRWINEYGPCSLKHVNFDVRYMPKAFYAEFLPAIIKGFEWIVDNLTIKGHNNGVQLLAEKYELCLPYLETIESHYVKLAEKLTTHSKIIDTKKLSFMQCMDQCPEVLKFLLHTYQKESNLSESYIPTYIWIMTPFVIDFSICFTGTIFKNMTFSINLHLHLKFKKSSQNLITFDTMLEKKFHTEMSITIEIADATIYRALEQLESTLMEFKWAGALVCINVVGEQQFFLPTVRYFFTLEKMFCGLQSLWSIRYRIRINGLKSEDCEIDTFQFDHLRKEVIQNTVCFNTDFAQIDHDVSSFVPGKYAVNLGKNRQVGNPGGGDLCMQKDSALQFCIVMYSLLANYKEQGDIWVLWIGCAYCQELRMLFKFLKFMDAKTGQHIRGRLRVLCTEINENCFKENIAILNNENLDWISQVTFRLVDITTEMLVDSDLHIFAISVFFIKGERIFAANLLHVLYNINPKMDVITFKNNIVHDNLGTLDFHGKGNIMIDLFNGKYGESAVDRVVLFNMARFSHEENQEIYNNWVIIKLSEWFQTTVEKLFVETAAFTVIDLKRAIPLHARKRNTTYDGIFFDLHSKTRLEIIYGIYAILKKVVNDFVFATLTEHLRCDVFSNDMNRGQWFFSLGGKFLVNNEVAEKTLDHIQQHY